MNEHRCDMAWHLSSGLGVLIRATPKTMYWRFPSRRAMYAMDEEMQKRGIRTLRLPRRTLLVKCPVDPNCEECKDVRA